MFFNRQSAAKTIVIIVRFNDYPKVEKFTIGVGRKLMAWVKIP
nr:MAG TPA: hypothetical protein [Caudoviricetes sp.]